MRERFATFQIAARVTSYELPLCFHILDKIFFSILTLTDTQLIGKLDVNFQYSSIFMFFLSAIHLKMLINKIYLAVLRVTSRRNGYQNGATK